MESWRTEGGVDWLCLPPSTGPATAELGLVIAHGYGHESPSQLGIGAAAASALAQALSRPVETVDQRIVEPSVMTQVGLQEMIIVVRGDVEAVGLGAQRLEQLLRDPDHLDGNGQPDPRRFGWTGWAQELAAWFGVGPATLAAENLDPWVGDPDVFAPFVRSLHPAAGRRVVAWTDVADLVHLFGHDDALGDARPQPPSPPPLRWREPAPATAAGSTTASYANNLISVRMPSGPLTDLALTILGETVHRSLVVLTRLADAVEVTWESVDGDELYALRAVPREGTTDWVEVRAALVQAVDAVGDTLDPLLGEHLSRARERVGPRSPVTRAVQTVRSGVPTGADHDGQALGTATIDDVRRALRQVQGSSLVSVGASELDPPGRPRFVAPVPPPVTRPTVKRRSLVFLWLREVADRQRIRADASTLQQTLVPKYRRNDPGALQPTSETIDLTRLAARIDRGEQYSTLIDQDDRRLTLVWPAYFRPAPLRRLVDAATPTGATLTRNADPMHVAQLRSDLRKAAISTVLTTVLLVVAAVLIILHPVTGTPKAAEQDPVVTTVAVGTVITLGNGSTVQVSQPTWRKVATSTFSVLVVDVRYCGGGVTVDPNSGEDARNYISPDRFELTGTTVASRQTYILQGSELKTTQLQQGQCTAGKVAFDLDADRPRGIVVSYHNGSGDRLGWSLS